MLSLPAATSRKKPITISCSSRRSPSISAWTRTLVRSSVGFSRRSAISLLQRSKISGTSRSMIAALPPGLRSGSLTARTEFMSRAQSASSSGGIPMKLWITRETTGCATSETRSHVSPVAEPVEDVDRDRPDRLLVIGDPLRREAALEQRLEAVVLGRVHADEHRLLELERQDRVGQRRDPRRRGVGLPVAADGVDVVGRGHRPEALLVRVLGDARRSSGRGTRRGGA